MVQWLGLCTLTAENLGSIPGLGTKIPQAKTQPKKNLDGVFKETRPYGPGPRWEVRTSNTSKLGGAQHPLRPTPFPRFTRVEMGTWKPRPPRPASPSFHLLL